MRNITKTLLAFSLLFSSALACDDGAEPDPEFRSGGECEIVGDLTIAFDVDGFEIETPRGCDGDIYVSGIVTWVPLDPSTLIVVDEIDSWAQVEPFCDPSSQSCPPLCDPSVQTCPSKPKKIWITTDHDECIPLSPCF